MRCKHHYCRCARSRELSLMGRDLEAIVVHDQEVECRLTEEERERERALQIGRPAENKPAKKKAQ